MYISLFASLIYFNIKWVTFFVATTEFIVPSAISMATPINIISGAQHALRGIWAHFGWSICARYG